MSFIKIGDKIKISKILNSEDIEEDVEVKVKKHLKKAKEDIKNLKKDNNNLKKDSNNAELTKK